VDLITFEFFVATSTFITSNFSLVLDFIPVER